MDNATKLDGRRVPEGEKQYDITRIWDTHHEIARMLVLGFSPDAIAKQLNITTQTVSNVRNHPLIKGKIDEMQAARSASVSELQAEIREMMPSALTVIKDIMENENAKNTDRLRAAIAVVDKSIPTIQKSENIYAVLSSEDIVELKERYNKEKSSINPMEVINE